MIATSRFKFAAFLRSLFKGDKQGHGAETGVSGFWVERVNCLAVGGVLITHIIARLCVHVKISWNDVLQLLIAAFWTCVLPVYMAAARECVVSFVQMDRLENCPVVGSCPLLWSDPYANYIWWLA